MNKEFSLSRPTFKRTLRRISIISVLLTMTLIWLLICVASVLTLKQYAQKNLDLTAATMAHSLEAALVFSDNAAAAETLATLGRQDNFQRRRSAIKMAVLSPHGAMMREPQTISSLA